MSIDDEFNKYRKLFEQLHDQFRIQKLFATDQIAEAFLEQQKSVEALASQVTRFPTAYELECERALAQIRGPWDSLLHGTRLLAERQYDEMQRALHSASGSLIAFDQNQLDAVRQALQFQRYPDFASELERLQKQILGPNWRALIDRLSTEELNAAELVEEAASAADEAGVANRAAAEKEWREKVSYLLAILSFLIAVGQCIRAEMLAANSDKGLAAAETRLNEALQAQALVIGEIRATIKRQEDQRWRVRDRKAILRLDPRPGSKRLLELLPGEIALELDQDAKWLFVEVKRGDITVAGWVLKKRVERIVKR